MLWLKLISVCIIHTKVKWLQLGVSLLSYRPRRWCLRLSPREIDAWGSFPVIDAWGSLPKGLSVDLVNRTYGCRTWQVGVPSGVYAEGPDCFQPIKRWFSTSPDKLKMTNCITFYAFLVYGNVWNICECWYVPYARYDTWYMIYICGYIVMLSALKWPLHCFLLFVFGRSVARWTLRGPFETFLTGDWLGATDGRRLSLTSRIGVPPSSVDSYQCLYSYMLGCG
jgi:hypothetical protein